MWTEKTEIHAMVRVVAFMLVSIGICGNTIQVGEMIWLLIDKRNDLQTNVKKIDLIPLFVVLVGLFLWFALRIFKWDIFWIWIMKCCTCTCCTCCNCIEDDLLKLTLVRLMRRPIMIGVIYYVVWRPHDYYYYHIYSSFGYWVTFIYQVFDFWAMIHEWSQTPDGKLCRCSKEQWAHISHEFAQAGVKGCLCLSGYYPEIHSTIV